MDINSKYIVKDEHNHKLNYNYSKNCYNCDVCGIYVVKDNTKYVYYYLLSPLLSCEDMLIKSIIE